MTDKQDTTRPLNLEEKSKLKHVSGQLNWITTQSRPDLAFENCTIGNSSTNATVKSIIQANKALKKAALRTPTFPYLPYLSLSFPFLECLPVLRFPVFSFFGMPTCPTLPCVFLFGIPADLFLLGNRGLLWIPNDRLQSPGKHSLGGSIFQRLPSLLFCHLLSSPVTFHIILSLVGPMFFPNKIV